MTQEEKEYICPFRSLHIAGVEPRDYAMCPAKHDDVLYKCPLRVTRREGKSDECAIVVIALSMRK